MNRQTPQQLPLDLGREPLFSRDDLIVTPANAGAVELIDRWPDWPAPVVILAGPAGSGKSHLAAIWRGRSDAAVVDPAHIEAEIGRFREGGPFVLDGADSANLDQTGLFHLINLVRQSGSHLLITSRRYPAAWGISLPDLASRLKAAATVEIHEPDDALLAGVITKLFADRQIDVEPHVVSFIARRIERSLATAIDVVDRLDRAALSQQSRITRALAAEVVNALDEGQGQLPL